MRNYIAHELNTIARVVRPHVSDAQLLRTLHLTHRMLAQHWADTSHSLNERLSLVSAIRAANHNGRMRVHEWGRDCDSVQYSGRVHEIDATPKAFDELHDRIAQYADGPFSLWPIAWGVTLSCESRDLAAEAFENGHAHFITAAE